MSKAVFGLPPKEDLKGLLALIRGFRGFILNMEIAIAFRQAIFTLFLWIIEVRYG